MSRRLLVSTLILVSTGLGAFSKWLLVWLFARSEGGASAVGTYALILSVGSPIFVVAQLGLRTIVLSARVRWPWRRFVVLRLSGLAAGTIALTFFVVLAPEVPLFLGTGVLALKIVDSLLDLELARIQFGGKLLRLGVLISVNGLTTIVVCLLVFSYFGSATAAVFAAAFVAAGSYVVASRLSKKVAYAATEEGKYSEILRLSMPVTAAQFLSTLLFQLPVIVLGWVSDPATVGIFAGAAYVLTVASLFGAAIQTTLITPLRTRRERLGDHAVSIFVWRTVYWVLLGGLVPSILFSIYGSTALQTVYGSRFEMSALELGLLAVSATLIVASYVFSVGLTVLNQYARVATVLFMSSVVSVTVGLYMVALGSSPLLIGSAMAFGGAATRFTAYAGSLRAPGGPRQS